MSMNIRIVGVRDIQVISTGAREQQHVGYDAWETPTSITIGILASPDPAGAYCDWLMTRDVYTETVCAGYVAHFRTWLADVQARGYTVRYTTHE